MTTRSIIASSVEDLPPVLRGESYYSQCELAVPFECVYRVSYDEDMIRFSVFYDICRDDVPDRDGIYIGKDIYGDTKAYRLFATVLVLPDDVIYKISAKDYLYKHVRSCGILDAVRTSILPMLTRLQFVLEAWMHDRSHIVSNLKVKEVI